MNFVGFEPTEIETPRLRGERCLVDVAVDKRITARGQRRRLRAGLRAAFDSCAWAIASPL